MMPVSATRTHARTHGGGLHLQTLWRRLFISWVPSPRRFAATKLRDHQPNEAKLLSLYQWIWLSDKIPTMWFIVRTSPRWHLPLRPCATWQHNGHVRCGSGLTSTMLNEWGVSRLAKTTPVRSKPFHIGYSLQITTSSSIRVFCHRCNTARRALEHWLHHDCHYPATHGKSATIYAFSHRPTRHFLFFFRMWPCHWSADQSVLAAGHRTHWLLV